VTVTGIVSADDHVVEPAHLWTSRLPQKFQDRAPRLVREHGHLVTGPNNESQFKVSDEGDWADIWHYEDFRVGLINGAAAVGMNREEIQDGLVTFDQIRPGCYEQKARLEDMDAAGIEASLCFPNTFVRFSGQRFFFAKDKELALACLRAYNDFIVEEWSANTNNRIIPCSIVPLWDPQLAAEEIRRQAARGVHAVTFSEMPPYLGLPSIYSGHWDPFFEACNETKTAIMLHVGSSSQLPNTSADAPFVVVHALPSNNSAAALVDWLSSGKFEQFPDLKVCLAESNIGWVPYFLQRMDMLWDGGRHFNGLAERLTKRPSEYYYSNMVVTFFSDQFGTQNLDIIGEDNAIFETDYPHGDSTWPDCLKVGLEQTAHLDPVVQEKVLRGNARRLFSLD
jgi:predicted TIM-barrel fold metal-dependent hydrolase